MMTYNVMSFTGFDMRMVTAAMALPVVQRVLKMGFTEALVKSAIETKLRASGKFILDSALTLSGHSRFIWPIDTRYVETIMRQIRINCPRVRYKNFVVC